MTAVAAAAVGLTARHAMAGSPPARAHWRLTRVRRHRGYLDSCSHITGARRHRPLPQTPLARCTGGTPYRSPRHALSDRNVFLWRVLRRAAMPTAPSPHILTPHFHSLISPSPNHNLSIFYALTF